MYGHVKTMAEAELKGIRSAGGEADLFQYDYPHLYHLPSSKQSF